MDLAPRQGPSDQSLGVIPMAAALVVAAFLGGGLGLLIEGGTSANTVESPETEQSAD